MPRTEARYDAFAEHFKTAIANWGKLRRRRSGYADQSSTAFTYLNEWLGLKQVAALEPNPAPTHRRASVGGSRTLQRQPRDGAARRVSE
jgi:zinc/manganese transport system substrate-binding protein